MVPVGPEERLLRADRVSWLNVPGDRRSNRKPPHSLLSHKNIEYSLSLHAAPTYGTCHVLVNVLQSPLVV